jgi:hypothetical protein
MIKSRFIMRLGKVAIMGNAECTATRTQDTVLSSHVEYLEEESGKILNEGALNCESPICVYDYV